MDSRVLNCKTPQELYDAMTAWNPIQRDENGRVTPECLLTLSNNEPFLVNGIQTCHGDYPLAAINHAYELEDFCFDATHWRPIFQPKHNVTTS